MSKGIPLSELKARFDSDMDKIDMGIIIGLKWVAELTQSMGETRNNSSGDTLMALSETLKQNVTDKGIAIIRNEGLKREHQ